jgi:diguanylate cyclase (GGDEF)-like protein/PAS domain S-box-containing protein
MFRVLTCLGTEHDWRLVALASLICFLACFAAIGLLHRARATGRWTRANWILTTGAATGTGIWATHFIAMLAYDPGVVVGYNIELTVLSLIAAIVVTAAGLGISVIWQGAFSALAGGAVVGIGVACMHYLGMWSLEFPGRITWAPDLVANSIILGVVFSSAAIGVAARGDRPINILGAGTLLAFAIVSHHFTAMGAIDIVADPTREIAHASMSPTNMAITIAGAAMSILGMCVVAGVGDRRTRRAVLQRDLGFRMLVEGVADHAIFTLDPHGYVTTWNAGAERATGYATDEIIGNHFSCFYCEQDAASEPRRALDTALHNGIHEGEGFRLRKNGNQFLAQVVIHPIRDDKGGVIGFANIIRDITKQKNDAERISYMAHHDILTGLPNRAALNEHLERTLKAAIAASRQFAVLCIDLDRFKEVNDTFGHPMGDRLLCEAAQRIANLYEGAFLARVGGDEFVIVIDDEEVLFRLAVDRPPFAFDNTFDISGNALQVGISTGAAIYPADGADAVTLMKNADAALYRAKEIRHGRIQFFDSDMAKEARERRALTRDLSNAIDRHELLLYYQPQACADGEITGFEALVRWRHSTRGFVPPAEFIPVAEDGGLILRLGEWVLREACREAASWPHQLKIAINISPVQFRHGDLAALVHTALLDTGLAASRLELEITEGVLVDDLSRALSILRRIKALGVRIAMDDFGTGYSSLSNLQAFPFDKIKIDQSFVSNLDCNPQSATIVRAILSLGRALRLSVMAEGVETPAQLAFLSKEMCEEVQGYLIGGPRPIAAYARLVGRAAMECSVAS